MKDDTTPIMKEAYKLGMSSAILTILAMIIMIIAVLNFLYDRDFEAGFALAMAFFLQNQAHHYMDRSYRLKGF